MASIDDNKTRPSVYRIRHLDSGKCYIGSAFHPHKRWLAHRSQLRRGIHHSKYLQSAWAKYGECAFAFEIIEHVPHATLIEREQWHMDNERPAYNGRPKAANCEGRTFKWTEESRARYSEWLRQNREMVSLRNKGRVHSAESRANMSEAHKGHKTTPEMRAKMSAAHKGRKHTPEARANMSRAQKARGLKLSEEDKVRLSSARTAAAVRRRAERESSQ